MADPKGEKLGEYLLTHYEHGTEIRPLIGNDRNLSTRALAAELRRLAGELEKLADERA